MNGLDIIQDILNNSKWLKSVEKPLGDAIEEGEKFIYYTWHEMNCIESFTLDHFFKYVYVGQDLKERIAIARRKMNI